MLRRRDITDRLLGYLPQDAGFHRGFTAFEAVDYVAVLKEHTRTRARHDEVRRVLELVGLGDVAGKKVRALSGGMRQRLGLAQALLGDPELFVLDEPTVGLDPEQRMRFRDLDSDAGRGRTVVLSTHQTEDVAAVCSDVVVMRGGRSVFAGPRPTSRTSPRAGVDRRRQRPAGPRRMAGRCRSPADAEVIAPTIEDAYLLLLGPQATDGIGEVA